jgi:hypothetical protein
LLFFSSFAAIVKLSVPGRAPTPPKEAACTTDVAPTTIPRAALVIKIYLMGIGLLLVLSTHNQGVDAILS